MSPAPAAAQVPVSVSLFDLCADAPILGGLSLVSHLPAETQAQTLRTSCPGIREDVWWTREEHDKAFWSLLLLQRTHSYCYFPA